MGVDTIISDLLLVHSAANSNFLLPHLLTHDSCVACGLAQLSPRVKLYQDDFNKAHCPLGQAGKFIRCSPPQLWPRAYVQRPYYPSKDDTDSCIHRSRVSELYVSLAIVFYRGCSNSRAANLLVPFYLLTHVLHSSRVLEHSLQSQMIPWLRRSR